MLAGALNGRIKKKIQHRQWTMRAKHVGSVCIVCRGRKNRRREKKQHTKQINKRSRLANLKDCHQHDVHTSHSDFTHTLSRLLYSFRCGNRIAVRGEGWEKINNRLYQQD